jgi:hypothetical protein
MSHLHLVRTSRTIIIGRARQLRAEIDQIFVDAEYWNSEHPNDQPIDPDPDGRLRSIADGIDAMLAKEQERKPHAG